MSRPLLQTLTRLIAACALSCLTTVTPAQGIQTQGLGPLNMNLFVQALVSGRAAEPLQQRPEWDRLVQQIQSATGSKGPLELRAMRVARFTQQPQCGRVEFGLWQPSTRQVIAQVGGQLNICIDGKPPLQECPAKPGVLVPTSSLCPGGGHAGNTQEVREAIAHALQAGGRTPAEVKRALAEGVAKRNNAQTGAKQ